MFTYSLLAFGFDADDRLSFGLVHHNSPLISRCQTHAIDIVKNMTKCFREVTIFQRLIEVYKLEMSPRFSPLPSFPSPSDFSSFPSDLQEILTV